MEVNELIMKRDNSNLRENMNSFAVTKYLKWKIVLFFDLQKIVVKI